MNIKEMTREKEGLLELKKKELKKSSSFKKRKIEKKN
jgi:hypothetical protein